MDKEILIRVKDKDMEAFSKLYDHYWEYAIRTATAVTGNKNDAKDAVQEAFIRVYKSIDKFDIDKAFNPWFYSILVNECRRILGHKSRTIPINDYMDNNIDYSKEDQSKLEEYQDLYEALQDLEENNKVPIILKYINDLSEKEISEVLGINVNTIKSRLYKGRENLRNALLKIEERRINNG